jgi:methylmalonyl-CoA mutase
MNPSMIGESGGRDVARQAGLSAIALARTPRPSEGSAGGRLPDPGSDELGLSLAPRREIQTKIVQRVDDPSPQRANAQALDDLANGADGLAIVFDGAPNAFGHGLPVSQKALATALNDVPLTRTHIRLDVHPQSRASVDWLVQILGARRVSPDKLDISFGIDPAALFAGTGRLRMSIEAMHASMPQSLAHFFALGVPGILLEADGRVFHNAGATDAQELGIMVASALSYLRMFEGARQPVLYASAHVGFATSLDQDHCRSIAKLRALRRLWARVLENYSVPPAEPVIHAETSYRMMTSRAPETNLARGTLAAMAAFEAGVSTFSPLPHTLPLGLPDAHARRLSRDALLVLAAEGNLAPVNGGAGGNLEAFVSSLCDRAWDELQVIEDEGGILKSVSDGHVQARIAASRRLEAERLREGLVPIVGTTLHPSAENGRKPKASTPAAASTEEGLIVCESLPAIRLEDLLEDGVET